VREGVKVLLHGRRLVIEDELAAPAGLTKLASDQGVWVGEKR